MMYPPALTVVDAMRSSIHPPSPSSGSGSGSGASFSSKRAQEPPVSLQFTGEYFGEKDVTTGDVHSGYRFVCPEVPGLVLVKDNVRGTGMPWSLRWQGDHR